MKYQVMPGTTLHAALLDLWQRRRECRAEADAFARRLGFSKYVEPMESSGGGIVALQGKAPKGQYTRIGIKGMADCWRPKNKAVLAQMAELPCVLRSEINTLLNFDPLTAGAGPTYLSPGVFVHDDLVLVSVMETPNYTPADGMAEILTSDYLRLYHAAKAELQAAAAEGTPA